VNGPVCPAMLKAVTVAAPPSISVVLARSPPAAATKSEPSSATLLVSLPSTGASLIGVIESVSVDVSVPPLPSETVYVRTGTGPA